MGSRDLDTARARLAVDQQSDGGISILPDHPEAYWPTSLAILAWNETPEFRNSQNLAAQFLLKTSGTHFPRVKESPYSHDSSIQGWPWIDGTHSWVIPTAMAVIALKVAGYSDHARVREATRLLLDRQLPKRGWNYGNTLVYGQELNPMVESTGVALNALVGSLSRDDIEPSLEYLKNRAMKVRTPLALSWSLLGLGAWGEEMTERVSWLETCWTQKDRYGVYDTVSCSLMLLALSLPMGILSLSR